MLKFLVFEDGRPPTQWAIRNAHLVGSDHSAIRCEIAFADGAVTCHKREPGAAALALQQPVGDCGELTVSTCLLPERAEPYLLSLEQARHRLMLIYNKMEEWGMFELGDEHPVSRRIERTRRLFIEALCRQPQDPVQADQLARECLASGIDASEELALAHAELFFNRRKAANALPRNAIGCGVALEQSHDRIRASLLNNFDFLMLPTSWRDLAPAEGEYRWGLMDNWADWAARFRVPVVAGPVVSFEPAQVPDWIYIWEHDYETVRDLLYEHTERLVSRYRNVVGTWNVVSGLHINSHFTFNFDQLMELTRMCTMLVKKLQPSARTLIELRQPFGEYYGVQQRSIPPLMYADLLIQGAVNFDALALRLLMGQAQPGHYTRDLMQISSLLDQFAVFGKPVLLTIAAPSEPVSELMLPAKDVDHPVDANSGCWRKPWSQLVQGKWLEAVFHIALSKPYIDSVVWQDIMDHPNPELPLAGLVSQDLQPKAAFRRLVTMRRAMLARGPAAPGSASSAALNAAMPGGEVSTNMPPDTPVGP